MTAPSNQADNVLAPASGSVVVAAVTATGAATDLNAAGLYNEYVTFQADGADIYVLFAPTSTVAAALDNTATGSGATVCAVIENGTDRSFRLRKGVDKFVGHKTASGTGTLRMFKSSPQGS